MMRLPILSGLVLATIAACSLPATETAAPFEVPAARPLDSLPGNADLHMVRQDLLATAADRFGEAALAEAMAAPAHLIAKRFAGMLPPPPPGETTQYVPPTALLVRRPQGWMVATGTGWHPAKADAAAEIDRVIADSAFWREEPVNLPCPDYGASLLLLKVPGKPETVRNSRCTSVADKAVLAALRA